MICVTRDANSSGFPNLEGHGTDAPNCSCTFDGSDASSGVANNPGAIVITRIPSVDKSRAIGNVIPTIAPFEAA